MIAYVAIVLWTGREHFRQVARRAFGRVPGGVGEKTEMVSYPLAFCGFLLIRFHCGMEYGSGYSLGRGASVLDNLSSTRYRLDAWRWPNLRGAS
jgi:hypothetical protein